MWVTILWTFNRNQLRKATLAKKNPLGEEMDKTISYANLTHEFLILVEKEPHAEIPCEYIYSHFKYNFCCVMQLIVQCVKLTIICKQEEIQTSSLDGLTMMETIFELAHKG